MVVILQKINDIDIGYIAMIIVQSINITTLSNDTLHGHTQQDDRTTGLATRWRQRIAIH